MYVLLTATEHELGMNALFYGTSEKAKSAMFNDILTMTSYETILDVVEDANRGLCEITDWGAKMPTANCGRGVWEIYEFPEGSTFILTSVTAKEMRDGEGINSAFYPANTDIKAVRNDMVDDIILMTDYKSLDDIVDGADAGECGFSGTDAWATTKQFGLEQWEIFAIPQNA